MTELLERLQVAVGSSYRVEGELTGGGMSRVFVATDTALGRRVVIKLLAPQMAAGVNVERFRREIQTVASLQHPHIVPLHAAGQAGDLVWYTMPLVEGESLRVRLARVGQLPIDEVIRILREVSDALAHAHAHGIVHRDIKPDNVLLSGQHALVTDFGVAKAVTESTGAETLTTIGVAIGTPAYMAPEQVAGEPGVDHRADVYAVGIVGYEMLTGHAPFRATTAQAMLAAHLSQTPEAVSARRDDVPTALDALVMGCLEKDPAKRWQTASELHRRLAAIELTGAATPRRWRRVAAVGAALLALLALAYVLWPKPSAAAVDPDVVAVTPFRIAGADPSLHYLREGMIDLLAAKLTGEGGGLRAADPRRVTSAWRRAAQSGEQDLAEDAALRVAHRLGAGRLLLGSVVGAPAHVVLSATLLAVPGGRTEAQAIVEGPNDSLPVLLDRLTSRLLVRGSRLDAEHEGSLTTTSLEALQAYLAGQAAYRRGAYSEAARSLGRALELDSNFALAAFAFVVNWGRESRPLDIARASRLAWAGRDRLSTRDRTLLEAWLGPRYPEPSLQADHLAARERAVQLAADQPDAWYFLGDIYYHQGRFLGYEDWMERATGAFQRAIALDSSFAGPLAHLIDIAALRGDTAAARRFGRLYLVDSTARGELYDLVVRWDLAYVLKDSTLSREFWVLYDSSPAGAAGLATLAQTLGAATGIVDSLQSVYAHRATTAGEHLRSLQLRYLILKNRGHLHDARNVADSLLRLIEPDEFVWLSLLLIDLYWGGEDPRSADAARRLAAIVDGPLSREPERRWKQYYGACVLGQWRLAHGQPHPVTRAIVRLHAAAAPRNTTATPWAATSCAMLLEAMQATAARRPDALRVVERLDSLMRLGPGTWWVPPQPPLPFENLALGRLFAALGDPVRGLAALRRGGYEGGHDTFFFSSYLREEGRLADLAGDRAGAIRAYQRYLALRPDPDAEVKPEVDAVRAELARVLAER